MKTSFLGKALLGAAFLACPCHLPVYILLFGGTMLGGYMAENKMLVAIALSAVFLFSLLSGWKMARVRG